MDRSAPDNSPAASRHGGPGSVLGLGPAPPSFRSDRRGGRATFVREDAVPLAEAVGFIEGVPRLPATGSVGGGRSAHSVFTVPGERSASSESHALSVVWKRCRRGGLAAPLLRDRYYRVHRFFRELTAHETARAASVPVSDLLALALTRTRAGGHRVEQLIRFEPNCSDAAGCLSDRTLDAFDRVAIVTSVAQTIRAFHDAGLLHGDLNLRNILVRPGSPPEAILIDLDPAPPSRLDGRSARGNLLRLFRSWTRLSRHQALPLPLALRWRFLRAYFGAEIEAARDFWREAERTSRRGRWISNPPPRPPMESR